MGLKDLFRNRNSDSDVPQPAPGSPATDPRADALHPNDPGTDSPYPSLDGEEAQHAGHTMRTDSAADEAGAQQLPAEGPLANLVHLLTSRGADRARLTLVQSGNVMTHQTRLASGDAPEEVENGTVDQGSPLFDDVADLYTLAMNTPTGPWRQVDLLVSRADPCRRLVSVDYAYPTGDTRGEQFVQDLGGSEPGSVFPPAQHHHAKPSQGAPAPLRDQDGHAEPGDAAPQERVTEPRPAQTGEGDAAFTQGQDQPVQSDAVRVVHGNSAVPATDGEVVAAGSSEPIVVSSQQEPEARDSEVDHDRVESSHQDSGMDDHRMDFHDQDVDDAESFGRAENHPRPQESSSDVSVGSAAPHSGVGTGLEDEEGTSPAEQPASSQERSRENTGLTAPLAAEEEATPSPLDAVDARETLTVSGLEESEEQGGARARDDSEIPDHVDESEFGGAPEHIAPSAPTGGLAAALAADGDPSAAPQVALSTDVAPSYTAPELDHSADALAPGNLVLTSRHIQSRLVNAQHYLFGATGTARDVSTVLIRVRALGTYYDALTHVRLNGFWDQRGTFELVPEDLLKVQEFKDDSYVEGHGAPLAMMFRFRPGVPPEVSFDYSDEEAFVRYEQRLPGQNYMEELRMYPRTGANIPQHVNDALQDWNY